MAGVPETMIRWDQIWFSVGAAYLDPTRSYVVNLATSDPSIVFHATTCGSGTQSFTIPTGNESFARTVALHACGTPGGTITATLMEGTTEVTTSTFDVTVTTPSVPRLPSIEFTNIVATLEEGENSRFLVRAFYLGLTNAYTIQLTTDSANVGFNSDCSDRLHSTTVFAGNASDIASQTLYACTAPDGTVIATLLRGGTVMDTASFDVTVTEPPPTPSVAITGLASTLAEGQNDAFEVVASHLTDDRPFFIEVTTSDGALGFDSACDSRFTELAVPLESETGTLSTTLYACATPGGTVTATLFRWSTTMDTATLDVTVVDPPEGPPSAPQGMDASLADGTFSLSWTALSGAANYEPQYGTGDSGDDWIALPTTTEASASFSPTDGPACGTTYKFRVRAFGDDTLFVASWGTPSDPDSGTTDACNVPPEFDPDSYTFSVAENAATGTSVGSVTATDDDTDDELSYAITSGNTGDVFAIGEITGAITVSGALDHETTTSYTLIVEVDDGRDGVDSATVTITVTDVAEDTPPAPENLDASLAGSAFSLSWDALSGAANYEPQYSTGDSDDDWIALPTTTEASASFSPTDGPACGTTYKFRVRAFGDDTLFVASWGTPSDPDSVTTDACNVLPEFDPAVYAFSVAENAATGTSVGTVSATDDDTDDELSYAITSGNTGDVFDIGETTGAITVSGALDHETTASYTLIVEVDDGREGTDTATVTITVTDVAENTPPAPENLSASLTDDTFSISWDTLSGSANYEPQYRTGDSDDDWMALPTTTGTSTTFSPAGGAACGTTYGFRVRAYGDGTKYIADWGTPSATDSVTTDACNLPPEFDPDSYTFAVAENASSGTAVGTVIATDDDTDDELSYSITSGNTGDVFDIGETTGAITVAGALDHETTASYTLTVDVDDGREGTDTATLTITVTDVAEDTPPAPENLDASLVDSTFSLTWDALLGAANYEPQYRIGDSDDDWMELPTTTGVSTTFSPTDGPACGTTYGFRVRAYGDGTKYIADWGTPSATDSVTTDACVPPEFDPATYTFSAADNVAVGASVGTVTATDENNGDTVSYTIVDADVPFSIGSTSGEISVNGALDYDMMPSYTLTVQATDRAGLTVTATVTVTVIAVPRQGERELWNGTLTAGPMTIGRADAFGYTSGVNTTSTTTEPSGAIEPSGTMQNATFEYGGQTYTIELAAYVHAFNGAKLFFVGLAERPLPSDTTLVAYVNGHRLSSWQTAENIDTYNYYSDASNFTVINGQVVSLSLYKTNPSDDSTLSSLTLSTGTITPAFDAGTTSYSATVSSTATSITITAEAMSDYAAVDVSPSGGDDPNTDGVEVTVGDQPTNVTVTVTAEDGSTTDYTLTITRESA